MNKIKQFLRPIHDRWVLLGLLKTDFKYLLKSFGEFNTTKDEEKFRSKIIMQVHVIEKGLSLKDVKPGFGVPKVRKLLNEIERYANSYGNTNVIYFALSIVDAYIKFNDAHNQHDAEILSKYEKICQKHSIEFDHKSNLKGGTIAITKQQIIDDSKVDYFRFVKARHSIRSFTGYPVDINKIRKALEIAEYTPSACNRQPWHNYVFTNKDNVIKILELQSGARQFKEDVAVVIIVTSSAKAFYGYEFNQHYVNGGLYAMNLLLAIHSQGLGAIPLNMGIPNNQMKEIKQFCNIAESDEPILIIAVGDICDTLNVAASRRFSYNTYTTFDK